MTYPGIIEIYRWTFMPIFKSLSIRGRRKREPWDIYIKPYRKKGTVYNTIVFTDTRHHFMAWHPRSPKCICYIIIYFPTYFLQAHSEGNIECSKRPHKCRLLATKRHPSIWRGSTYLGGIYMNHYKYNHWWPVVVRRLGISDNKGAYATVQTIFYRFSFNLNIVSTNIFISNRKLCLTVLSGSL